MLDVITIGSATKDAFLISKGFKLINTNKFSTGVGECFAYGEKVEVSDLNFSSGGGATNAAATMSNLGIKAGVYTQVGDDLFGHEIISDLKARKINVSNLHLNKNHKTAYSTILLSPHGDRTILVYRGASHDFEAKQLNAKKLKAKWFYLTATAGNLAFIKKTFAIAKSNNTNVFWNPGGGEFSLGLKVLAPYLNQTQVLSLNKEEAQKLTGDSNLKNNLNILGEMVPVVLITDGKVGAYLNIVGDHYFVPSLGTEAVNTTGAGDAFGSGFVAGLILKKNWQFAVRLAILNSDGVISHMGAKTGLLKRVPPASRMSRVKINSFKR